MIVRSALGGLLTAAMALMPVLVVWFLESPSAFFGALVLVFAVEWRRPLLEPAFATEPPSQPVAVAALALGRRWHQRMLFGAGSVTFGALVAASLTFLLRPSSNEEWLDQPKPTEPLVARASVLDVELGPTTSDTTPDALDTTPSALDTTPSALDTTPDALHATPDADDGASDDGAADDDGAPEPKSTPSHPKGPPTDGAVAKRTSKAASKKCGPTKSYTVSFLIGLDGLPKVPSVTPRDAAGNCILEVVRKAKFRTRTAISRQEMTVSR